MDWFKKINDFSYAMTVQDHVTKTWMNFIEAPLENLNFNVTIGNKLFYHTIEIIRKFCTGAQSDRSAIQGFESYFHYITNPIVSEQTTVHFQFNTYTSNKSQQDMLNAHAPNLYFCSWQVDCDINYLRIKFWKNVTSFLAIIMQLYLNFAWYNVAILRFWCYGCSLS